MNSTLFYGIVLALVEIVLALVAFFLGFQTDKIAEGQWFALLNMVAAIVIVWLGTRAAREESKDKTLTYGRGVLTGFLISLYSGLILAVYTFIHYKFINPNFTAYLIDFVRQKWIAAGMADAQMAVAEKFTRFMTSPPMLAVTVIFHAAIYGIIIALIVAAFLRRAPAAPQEEPPPVQSQ